MTTAVIDHFHKDLGLETFLVLIALALAFYGSYLAARRRIEARRDVERELEADGLEGPEVSRGDP